jgi:hypothetical protein
MSNLLRRAKPRWHVPSPAMAVALIALFVAMGGSAIAASHYLINSTKQINPKVLKKLRGNVGRPGTNGLPGLQGKEGTQGKEGAQGKEGSAGKNLTGQTTLPSGQSESGAFSAGGGWDAGNGKGRFGYIGAGISYVQPLATPVSEEHIVDIQGEGATTAQCPGVGKAARGYLCLYDYTFADVHKGYGYSNTTEFSTPSPGVVLYWEVKEAGEPYSGGEYTVTAP